MAVYAIGDVQGCFAELERLLEKIDYQSSKDQLWFVGDLINRGPDSLGVLRFLKSLGDRAVCVLGNHDLHLLARAHGLAKPRPRDTLDEILRAPDLHELLVWLRTRPLLHNDEKLGYMLSHAGVYPGWDARQAVACAREVENFLRGANYEKFLPNMYGNAPSLWHDDLRGDERLRFIINAFTRMRFCDAAGALNLEEKRGPGEQAENLWPWYEWPKRKPIKQKIIFGHWSTLGVRESAAMLALDAGCVYGGHLTAAQLQRKQVIFHRVRCTRSADPLSVK